MNVIASHFAAICVLFWYNLPMIGGSPSCAIMTEAITDSGEPFQVYKTEEILIEMIASDDNNSQLNISMSITDAKSHAQVNISATLTPIGAVTVDTQPIQLTFYYTGTGAWALYTITIVVINEHDQRDSCEFDIKNRGKLRTSEPTPKPTTEPATLPTNPPIIQTIETIETIETTDTINYQSTNNNSNLSTTETHSVLAVSNNNGKTNKFLAAIFSQPWYVV